MSARHRIPSLWTAALASASIALCTLAGTSCDFISLDAEPGNLLLDGNGVELMAVTSGLGVLCKNDFYDKGDQMWLLSRIFLCVSLSLGGVSVLLAWAVSTLLAPSEFNWRLLSFLSAATAVTQVPIFLILESTPCTEARETQRCTLSRASFYLIGSTVGWIMITVFTQCFNPPLFPMQISVFKNPKKYARNTPTDDEALEGLRDHQEVDAIIEARGEKRSMLGWFSLHSEEDSWVVPAVETDPMRDDSFDLESPRRQRDPEDPLRSDAPVLLPSMQYIAGLYMCSCIQS